MAGSRTPQGQTVTTLERAIREAGRIPVQRNTFYQQLNGHKTSEEPAKNVAAVGAT